jgi:hypothetical protein
MTELGRNILPQYIIYHTCLTVFNLVVAMRHKPKVCRFDSQSCYWNFSTTQSFRPQYDTGVTHWQVWVPVVSPGGGGGVKAAGVYSLTTSVYWLSRNSGTFNPWRPVGLSRAVQGLLYLLACYTNSSNTCCDLFSFHQANLTKYKNVKFYKYKISRISLL